MKTFLSILKSILFIVFSSWIIALIANYFFDIWDSYPMFLFVLSMYYAVLFGFYTMNKHYFKTTSVVIGYLLIILPFLSFFIARQALSTILSSYFS
ncbi:hypothetical protein AB4865_02670 [Capnocytophaga sp. ARDL2]|uniref:hypothetical protein n=1 Tax=Capnocytophaga sp. ARDL2 TaxID=3238809 RepID=UPI0035567AD0